MSELKSRSQMRRCAVQDPNRLIAEIERLRAEWKALNSQNTILADTLKASDALRARVAELEAENAGLFHDERSAAIRVNRLEADNARLREALKFYANEKNWKGKPRFSGTGGDGTLYCDPSRVDKDEGKKARAALEVKP